jgi:hypothetical protein
MGWRGCCARESRETDGRTGAGTLARRHATAINASHKSRRIFHVIRTFRAGAARSFMVMSRVTSLLEKCTLLRLQCLSACALSPGANWMREWRMCE